MGSITSALRGSGLRTQFERGASNGFRQGERYDSGAQLENLTGRKRNIDEQ